MIHLAYHFIVCLLTAVPIKSQSFTVSVTSVTTNVGSNIALICHFNQNFGDHYLPIFYIPYQYSWSPGSDTDDTLNINGVSVSDAGRYTCTVNARQDPEFGSHYVTVSGKGTLRVNLPSLTISVTALYTNVNIGANTALTCTPSISGGISDVTYAYSWSPGSDTDNTLNINGVSVSDAGRYTCTVTASYTGSNSAYVTDSTGSKNVTITVKVPGMITISPISDATINVGGSHTFMCSATPPNGLQSSHLSYQWTNPSGTVVSNTISYTISSSSVTDASAYTCTVTASHSNTFVTISNPTNSDTATLTIGIPSPTVSVTNTTASVGNNTTLTCTPSIFGGVSGVTYAYSWSPGSDTDNTSNINGVSVSDAGQYTCTVTASYTGSNSAYVTDSTGSGIGTLTVNLPSPTISVTSITTDVDSNAALTCTPSISGVSISVITYTYSWSPGSHTDNTLNINGVSVSDAGRYTCTVTASYTGSNSAYVTDSTGSGMGTINVNVPGMISISSISDAKIDVGGSHTFTCSATPPNGLQSSHLSYQWTNPSGTVVSNTVNYAISSSSVADAGVYTCRVTANHSNTFVTISNPTNSDTAALTIGILSHNIAVSSAIANVNNNAVLKCTLTGNTNGIIYTYSWSPGGSNTNSFSFMPTSVSDAGQYTCTVTASYTGSNSAYVKINSPSQSGMGTLYVTDTTVSPVSITRLTASPYDVFDINCTVTLTPNTANTIAYAWMIPNGFTSRNTASSTLTSNVTDTTGTHIVTCNAIVTVTGVDGMATASDSGTIIVKGPSNPIKPVITGISVTPNDAMMLWIISEVTYTPETYVIECGVEMDNFNLTSPPVSTMNTDSRGFTTDNDIGYTQTITGLNIAITYYCHISSTNTIGTNYSDIFNFTTEETTPHSPSNTTLVAINSTSLILSWKEPKPFTGAITDYNYTCTNVNGSVNYASSDMTPNNPSLMRVILTGLQPHREYTCNVTASTSKDIGAIGAVNGITNEAAPTGPPLSFTVNFDNVNGFILNWSPPDLQLRNGIIRSYTYNCTEVGSTITIVQNTITTSTTVNIILSNMIKPFTNYTCSLYASTSAGSGPSVSAIGTSNEDVPSEVVSLTVSSSDTSFHIFWSPPAIPNGIITYYTVRLRNYTNGHVLYTVNVTVPSLIISNEGLVSFIPYSISVSGTTSAGNGNEVSVIGFTTEGIPSLVKGLAFDRINITAFNISWTPLTLLEARGFVEYTLIVTSSSDTTHVMTLSGDVSHIIVNSIQSNVDYRVILYGSTNGGGSGPSVTLVIPKEDEVDSSNIMIVAVSGSSGILIVLISIVIVMVTSVWIILKCRKKKSVDIKNNNPIEPEYEMITNSNTKPSVQPATPPLYDVPVSSPRDVNVQVQDNVAYSAI